MDLSKSLFTKEQYLRADNFRLVTELGKSELSIETIRGNDLLLAIDATSSVFELLIDKTIIPAGLASVDISFTMGATTVTDTWTVDNLNLYSIREIYELLRDFINQSAVFNAQNYLAATKGKNVVIHRDSGFFTNNGTITVGLTQPWIIATETVPAIDYPKLIGRGYIRDEVVLITTDTDSVTDDPEDLISYMQLWKLSLNPVTIAPTLSLIYNGLLHGTTAHPVPSVDGSVGRRENDFVSGFYWTDNYNPPRKLNITDPDAFALDAQSLNLRPLYNPSEIVLQEILQSGGQLKTGIYNFSYRLTNNNGTETVYSPLSNNVQIIPHDENIESYWSYREGTAGASTNKAITCLVTGVDNNYDNI